MDNYILEIPNFVSPELCNEIVQRFENDTRKKHQPALYTVYGKKYTPGKFSKEIVMAEHKEYKDIIQPICDVYFRVYDKYLKHLDINFNYLNKDEYVHPYIREVRSNKEIGIRGGFVLHKIDKGELYSWHHDQNWRSNQNFIQIIIYLNTLEEHEGGHTEFISGRKVRPEIGKVLVYPRSWIFLHKGNKIIGNNPKYICTADILVDFKE
jgi:hypothetical protein